MTLREKAVERYLEMSERMTPWNAIYSAGWENGEWTCCCCGTMIGKNLKGESPWALARTHADGESWQDAYLPLHPKPEPFAIEGDCKGW